MIVLELILLIGIMICFLEGPLVVILSFGLPFTLLLYTILLILIIMLESNFGNTFWILKIFSMLSLVAWVSN